MVRIPTKPGLSPDEVPLVLMCVERCGAAIELSFGFLRGANALAEGLRQIGWFLSLGGARERGDTTTPSMVWAPLCDRCVEKVHRPEVVERAREELNRRKS